MRCSTRAAPICWSRSPPCATRSGSPPATSRPGGWSWSNAPPKRSRRRWRGWARASWWCPRIGTRARRVPAQAGTSGRPADRQRPETPAYAGDQSATLRPRGDFRSEDGEARLKELHGLATLDGLGDFTRPMLAAAAGLLAYLDHAGRGEMPFLLPPRARGAAAHLAMDAATRSSLEILAAQSGGRAGQPAGDGRSLRHRRGRAAAGRGSRRAARDTRRDRRAAGGSAAISRPIRCCAPICAACCAGRPISAARLGRVVAGAAARAIWGRCATDWPRRGGSAT
jgi:hypothetical protein